jgi:hypothetical protein
MRGEKAVDVDPAEFARKRDVLIFIDRLIAEKHHAVIGKSGADLRQIVIVQPGEIDAQNFRADAAVGANFNCHRSLPS